MEVWGKFDADVFISLSVGYESNELYRVAKTEDDALTSITFTLETLPEPFVKVFEHRKEVLLYYTALAEHKLSFLAKDSAGTPIGLVVAGVTQWHRTVNLWEFHVAKNGHRGKGIGRKMMETLIQHAKEQKLRVIEVETSNRNVPAMRFYRKMGFQMEKLDMSFYSNQDLEKQEICVFMKLRIGD